MAGGGIPTPVEQFVRTTLVSVQQLEVLLLLHEQDDRPWTPAEVSATLRTNPDAAERCLTVLAAGGIVSASDGQPATFRYDPPPGARALVDELARLYPAYRTRIIGLIYSQSNESVEAFADAFRLRRRKER